MKLIAVYSPPQQTIVVVRQYLSSALWRSTKLPMFSSLKKRSRSVKESATEAGVIVARMVSQPIHLLRMLPDCLRPFPRHQYGPEASLASAPSLTKPLPVKSAKTRGRAEVMRTKFRFCSADSATPRAPCARPKHR